jgi:Sulfotransferase family
MLDSHPHLAVPPESQFIVQGPGPSEDVTAALERIVAHPRFTEWNLPVAQVRSEMTRWRIGTYAALIDCLFRLFAEARGKRRWGDRTPQHAYYVPRLIGLFPRAQFIHVIRDGREVASSIFDHGWTGSVITAADHWRRTVAAGRRWARLGPDRYHEICLETLIDSPAETLRNVCAFLGEDYAPQMLEYQRDARARVPVAEWERSDHSNTERAPTPSLRDWTTGLSHREQIAVEAVCARQLKLLGMDPPRPPFRGHLIGMNHVLRTRAAERLHPHWRPDQLDALPQSQRDTLGVRTAA